MRFVLLLLSLGCLISAAYADVEFTAPSPSAVIKAGDVVTAHWKDSGSLPRISQLSQYDLYLCAEGNSESCNDEMDMLIEKVPFARGNSVSFRIDAKVSNDEPQTYSLKMISHGPNISVINYSERFTLAPVIEDCPQTIREDYERTGLRKRQEEGAYTIPYHLQSGPTRYAPMAKRPGSTVPPKSVLPTPQNPASTYDIATAYLPEGTVQTTKSASVTYSEVSIENPASPAPNPQDAQMKRWLERWKD